MKPNLLFLFPDQWRWDWLGLLGRVPVRTPNIDALAARGVRFEQCRTNSPLCAPARASLVTGRRFHRHNVPTNTQGVDPAIPNHMQALRAGGYHVAVGGKNDLHNDTPRGLDGWTTRLAELGMCDAIDQYGKMAAGQRGWPEPRCAYTSYLHKTGRMKIHADDYKRRREEATYATAAWPSPLEREHYTDDFCGRGALELLGRAPTGKPWHLWVNFPGPHDPFDPPRELQKLYDGVTFPEPAGPSRADADHQQLRRNYAACIEGLDQWVGRILGEVERRGEMDKTVVVFSSDHGEMLGDLGVWNKSKPYDAAVRVPLIVAGPGIVAGRVSGALVELCDLAATLLELAGLPAIEGADGRSFASVLHGGADRHRGAAVAQLADWRMVTDGRWKYVETAGKPSHLFDLAADPYEVANLIDQPGHGGQAARLRGLLAVETAR